METNIVAGLAATSLCKKFQTDVRSHLKHPGSIFLYELASVQFLQDSDRALTALI